MRQFSSLLILSAALAIAGCDQRMIDQPKDQADGASALFANGQVNRTPPEGTVARDAVFWDPQTAERPAMSLALLERGRERFDIFCAPCHSRTGDGDGMIVRRGMPQPPSLHAASLREASDRHFLQVITDGYGAMYGYGDRVPAADRWAIAAYIRALQLSRGANLAQLSAEVRRQAEENAR